MGRLALALPIRFGLLAALLGLYLLQPVAGWVGMIGIFVYGVVLPRLSAS